MAARDSADPVVTRIRGQTLSDVRCCPTLCWSIIVLIPEAPFALLQPWMSLDFHQSRLPLVAAPSQTFSYFIFYFFSCLIHFRKRLNNPCITLRCAFFVLFSTLLNKQMVSKMLKNKVAYVMFRTKLYTMNCTFVCGYCVYITCIH